MFGTMYKSTRELPSLAKFDISKRGPRRSMHRDPLTGQLLIPQFSQLEQSLLYLVRKNKEQDGRN